MNPKVTFKHIFDKFDKVAKDVADLATKQILVGIPEKNALRQTDAPTNAIIGYWHEYGVQYANREIPARPFLMPGVEQAKDEVIPELKEAARLTMQAVGNNKARAHKSLMKAGLICQNKVRAVFVNNDWAELSPVTIKQRQRKGHRGTRPLIESGQLRKSITYVIRRKD